jgi:hypothetical protein
MDDAKALDDALATAAADAMSKAAETEAAAPSAEVETSVAEKSALTEAVEAIGTAPADPTDPAAAEVEEPLPLFLKPLVWLNAPMELLPLGLRDALGKVAILTLANAIAVLAYVLIFRKHH